MSGSQQAVPSAAPCHSHSLRGPGRAATGMERKRERERERERDECVREGEVGREGEGRWRKGDRQRENK